jgi:hypothetical protein
MKIDLKIFHSILFAELRPWLLNNKSQDKFQRRLTSAFRQEKGDPKEFEKLLPSALQDFPGVLAGNEVIFELDEKSMVSAAPYVTVQEALIEFDIPQFSNSKTEFYYYLIKNEGTRQIHNINLAFRESLTTNIARAIVNKTLLQLKDLMKSTSEFIKQYGYEPELPFEQNLSEDELSQRKDSDYILKALRFTLIRLFQEIQELFPDYLDNPKVPDEELFFRYAGIPESNLRQSKKVSGLTAHMINRFLLNKEFSLQNAISLIEYIKVLYIRYKEMPGNQKELAVRMDQLTHHIKAIENYIYIRLFTQVSDNPSLDDLLSDKLIDKVFSESSVVVYEQLETLDTPLQKIEYINSEIRKLSFLNEGLDLGLSVYKLSIPRNLLQYLNTNIEYIKANMHIKPDAAKFQNIPKIPTDLSVDKLAYLFRALCDGQVMTPKVETDMYRAIVALFSSQKKDDLSEKSIKNKYVTPELPAVEYWIDGFSHLQRIAQKKYDELTR